MSTLYRRGENGIEPLYPSTLAQNVRLTGGRTLEAALAPATSAQDGLMSAEDKAALDNVASAALDWMTNEEVEAMFR